MLEWAVLTTTTLIGIRPKFTRGGKKRERTSCHADAIRCQLRGTKGQLIQRRNQDSQCAEMGSHEALMKRQGGPKDAKACTRGCITMSAQFVLYDANSNTVYRLDDQKKPKQFAGKKVMVTGTLDDGRKTIHVANIRAAS
jgi:uncharacterized protein DUF5818